ncbi:lysosomal acid glucosylceramidase-like [Ostrinia furnacalis]|uniref:lysosomal acid glucosylceramidase-like n=1 Tax=Ostrinia furnacalis TaxID=93504 RepID=UPI00103ACBD3|nr:lysosomal acid glucosylceramidase-like [Ostrinia furnacalis]
MQEAIDGTFPLTTLTLNVSIQYQAIDGFGGAITDAAGLNWLSLTNTNLRQSLIDSYFSSNGLEYNVIRTPIGGSDFSSRKYALNELPMYDKQLSNFSLAEEDFNLKIPMFKAAMKASNQDIYVIATTWSPPDWMKVSNGISVCGKLNPDYYQTYADYHVKFIDEYNKQGIKIWALTTTNEPSNAFLATMVFNCMGWSSTDQAKWIVNNFGPTVRASKYNNTLIFVNDDQRYIIPFLFNELVASDPRVLNYIDGVAVHGYADLVIPASILEAVTNLYPQLKLMMTEFCEGYLSPTQKVLLGSWDRAESYIKSILGNLNFGAAGYVDWNLCLNQIGGPNWALNFVDSPIIVFPEAGEFVKQPTYYAMGHFSKFLPRGSKRIQVNIYKSQYDSNLQNVAFVTPLNTVVVILYNPAAETRVIIKLGSQAATVLVPAQSVMTVEMVLDQTSYEPSNVNAGPESSPDLKESSATTSTTSTTPQSTNTLTRPASQPASQTASYPQIRKASTQKSPTRTRTRG